MHICHIVTLVCVTVSIVLCALILNKLNNKNGSKSGLRLRDTDQGMCLAPGEKRAPGAKQVNPGEMCQVGGMVGVCVQDKWRGGKACVSDKVECIDTAVNPDECEKL